MDGRHVALHPSPTLLARLEARQQQRASPAILHVRMCQRDDRQMHLVRTPFANAGIKVRARCSSHTV